MLFCNEISPKPRMQWELKQLKFRHQKLLFRHTECYSSIRKPYFVGKRIPINLMFFIGLGMWSDCFVCLTLFLFIMSLIMEKTNIPCCLRIFILWSNFLTVRYLILVPLNWMTLSNMQRLICQCRSVSLSIYLWLICYIFFVCLWLFCCIFVINLVYFNYTFVIFLIIHLFNKTLIPSTE